MPPLLLPPPLFPQDKVAAVAKQMYGAADVEYSPQAAAALDRYEAQGFGRLPVCMAKTQYSFSNDASLKGRPEGFTFFVREARASVGAGFIVLICGGEPHSVARCRPCSAAARPCRLRLPSHASTRAAALTMPPLCTPTHLPPIADLMMIPGLPTRPAFYNIDLDLETGRVLGLS